MTVKMRSYSNSSQIYEFRDFYNLKRYLLVFHSIPFVDLFGNKYHRNRLHH